MRERPVILKQSEHFQLVERGQTNNKMLKVTMQRKQVKGTARRDGREKVDLITTYQRGVSISLFPREVIPIYEKIKRKSDRQKWRRRGGSLSLEEKRRIEGTVVLSFLCYAYVSTARIDKWSSGGFRFPSRLVTAGRCGGPRWQWIPGDEFTKA